MSWRRKKGAHVIRVYIKQLCVFCHVIVCQSAQEIICALDLGLYSLAQMRSAKCLKQKISLFFCLVCLKFKEKDEFEPLDVVFLYLYIVRHKCFYKNLPSCLCYESRAIEAIEDIITYLIIIIKKFCRHKCTQVFLRVYQAMRSLLLHCRRLRGQE